MDKGKKKELLKRGYKSHKNCGFYVDSQKETILNLR
jgi:hypothetical protein